MTIDKTAARIDEAINPDALDLVKGFKVKAPETKLDITVQAKQTGLDKVLGVDSLDKLSMVLEIKENTVYLYSKEDGQNKNTAVIGKYNSKTGSVTFINDIKDLSNATKVPFTRKFKAAILDAVNARGEEAGVVKGTKKFLPELLKSDDSKIRDMHKA